MKTKKKQKKKKNPKIFCHRLIYLFIFVSTKNDSEILEILITNLTDILRTVRNPVWLYLLSCQLIPDAATSVLLAFYAERLDIVLTLHTIKHLKSTGKYLIYNSYNI